MFAQVLGQVIKRCNTFAGTAGAFPAAKGLETRPDRKSTRLNSSHLGISYAVFCLKKKKKRKKRKRKKKKEREREREKTKSKIKTSSIRVKLMHANKVAGNGVHCNV